MSYLMAEMCMARISMAFLILRNARVIVDYIADKKGIDVNDSAIVSYKSFKEKQYDRLADTLREYLDMDAVYGMLREARYD